MEHSKCRDCGATEKLVKLLDIPWQTPTRHKYFYLCVPCWKKDLANEGTSYDNF